MSPAELAAKGAELAREGRHGEACNAFIAAMSGGVESPGIWFGLAQSMGQLAFTAPDPAVHEWLRRMAGQTCLPYPMIYPPVMRYLALDPAFGALWRRGHDLDFEFQPSDLTVLDDPLFAAFAACGPTVAPPLERLLTGVRRTLLGQSDGREALRCAVARAAWASEYAFAESPAETAAVDALSERIARTGQVTFNDLANYAAYRRLHEAPWAPQLPTDGWQGPFEDLIRLALREPLTERELGASIADITPFDDAVSVAVQAQYEANPYPRWVMRAPYRPEPLPETIRTLHPNAPLAGVRWSERPDILIAGCGTGIQAIEAAQRHPSGSILAVDLSRASLGYAKRKTLEAGIANIVFARGDINVLDLGENRFDLVEAAGVLHHMGDPVAGWRKLAGMVKPGGLMFIGLYSRTARRWLNDIRARFGQLATAEDIRSFRHTIMSQAEPSPLLKVSDFYSLSECRDLVFHVQETQFDLPQIEAALSDLGLRFLGFALPPDKLAEYDARFPNDPARTDLSRWAQLERDQSDLFIGMYQFWVMKEA